MAETTVDVMRRYLEDAIAAEKSFESQLNSFAKEGNDDRAKALFHEHALETRSQHERLSARLHALDGEPSVAKTILAHLFAFSPKTASLGHEQQERTTHNLMIAHAVENSEIAMYEALAATADAAGDTETAALARSIQAEERATAERIWALIPSAAVSALGDVARGQPGYRTATQ